MEETSTPRLSNRPYGLGRTDSGAFDRYHVHDLADRLVEIYRYKTRALAWLNELAEYYASEAKADPVFAPNHRKVLRRINMVRDELTRRIKKAE